MKYIKLFEGKDHDYLDKSDLHQFISELGMSWSYTDMTIHNFWTKVKTKKIGHPPRPITTDHSVFLWSGENYTDIIFFKNKNMAKFIKALEKDYSNKWERSDTIEGLVRIDLSSPNTKNHMSVYADEIDDFLQEFKDMDFEIEILNGRLIYGGRQGDNEDLYFDEIEEENKSVTAYQLEFSKNSRDFINDSESMILHWSKVSKNSLESIRKEKLLFEFRNKVITTLSTFIRRLNGLKLKVSLHMGQDGDALELNDFNDFIIEIVCPEDRLYMKADTIQI